MKTVRDDVLKNLDGLIEEGKRIVGSYQMGEWGASHSSLPEADLQTFAISVLASVERTVGRDSEFYRQMPSKPKGPMRNAGWDNSYMSALVGTLVALRRAVDAGLLVSLERRVRANIYDDFLVQAGELVAGGYHVAAVVLGGGVLEDHLCKLCTGRALTWKGNGSLAKYNDLLRDKLYDQATWRRIQAIADVRNDAAHGNGAKVKQEDVADALRYISRFLADYPS
jgi:hypothetical protein